MKRPAVRIVFTDPGLPLTAPLRSNDLLIGPMLDLDDGAIHGRGSHVAEGVAAYRQQLLYRPEIVCIPLRSLFVLCGHMDDQIIDAAMARGLHGNACRGHPLAGWVVMRDAPDYPDKVVARLVTDVPSPCVLVADTLAGIQEQLPPGLVRSER